jgi:hypothetical protein
VPDLHKIVEEPTSRLSREGLPRDRNRVLQNTPRTDDQGEADSPKGCDANAL